MIDISNLKPCFSSYIFFAVLGLLGGAIFCIPLYIVDAFISGTLNDIYYFVSWGIGLILTVIYLSYYRVEVNENIISIPNSLFDHRRSTIRISELNDVKLDIGVGNKYKKSFYTLWLKTQTGRSQINIKTFSIKNLELFMKYIYDRNPSVTYDNYAQSMIEGKFKDILNKGISEFSKYVLALIALAIIVIIIIVIIL